MSAILHVGERNRAWFTPGPNDPAGPYEARCLQVKAPFTATDWAPLTSGITPGGVQGFYFWVVGVAVTSSEIGDVPLVEGAHRTQIRYVGQSGRLIDIDDTGIILVRP